MTKTKAKRVVDLRNCIIEIELVGDNDFADRRQAVTRVLYSALGWS